MLTNNVRGMLWMTLSGAVFSANYAVIRYLAKDFNIFELVFFRNLFGLVALVPFIWHARHEITIPKSPSIILVRGVLQVGSSSLWFYAVTVIPLFTATALMLIEPVIGCLLAIYFLKEPSDIKRWLSIFIGIIGAIIIVRPGIIETSLGIGMVIIAAGMWSGFLLLGKIQSKNDPTVIVIAYSSALTVLFSIIPAIFFWTTPNFEQLVWLVILGCIATFAYFCITNAYKWGEVTVVSPFTFMRTIFAAAIGFFVFSEIPDNWVWLGALLIVIAATYLARLEIRSDSKI